MPLHTSLPPAQLDIPVLALKLADSAPDAWDPATIAHQCHYLILWLQVTTEGDAFVLAFHDAQDAVAWCM